jgi:ABC-type multidrug transport system fused ATPase/permease subunit
MNSLQMIIKYWMKSKKNFTLSVLYQILSTIFALIPPIFIGRLVSLLDPKSTETFTGTNLLINFSFVIIFAILTYLAGRIGRIKGAEVSSRALYNLRADINDSIYRQSFAYFDKHETGQLVARATSDVDQTEMIFGFGLAVGLQSLIQVIGVLITATILAVQLSWIFAIVVPISVIISTIIAKKLKPVYIETRQAFGDLTNTIRENIVGSQVVRIFNTQEKERAKFASNNKRFFDASINSVKYNMLFMPFNMVLIVLMVIVVLFYGGNLILNDQMQLSTLITFQSYVGLMIFPLVILGQILVMYIQADAALSRVREILDSVPDVKDVANPIVCDRLKGDVDFIDVSFGYTPTSRILQKISFSIQAGKKLAIIGTTGSGKSTIINLLPRFYDVNEGKILIDGIEIQNYRISDLRRNIGIVSQETFLFNKTIAENIAFGKEEATMDEIRNAAKSANLDEFIENLPEKYNTIVGERGTRLSGGQKQRLSIARALIIKPSILIFDDSTSSVDVETEFKIQQSLEQIMRGVTTFIITQRISTIRNADLIVVLDKGRVVGFGTHDQLIQSNILYRQIYETLFQKQKTGLKSATPQIKEGI